MLRNGKDAEYCSIALVSQNIEILGLEMFPCTGGPLPGTVPAHAGVL